MSTHKHIDVICLVATLLALILCAAFANGEALGIQPASTVMGYETRLFDTTQVHTIDIAMEDWDSFIDTCENEEYEVCSVVIDGETYTNVGIRAKGNTSLSNVSSMDSNRYSFKIEFDQYDSTKSYHGLDKLSLNNLIQDATMMKDYLAYRLMGSFGAAAPLCSYVYITVNGEDWGLYLAVEGVEDSFLQRNYGTDHGELYKPDSLSMGGGGPGNGRDFNMEDFIQANPADLPTDVTGPEGETQLFPQMQAPTDGGRGNLGSASETDQSPSEPGTAPSAPDQFSPEMTQMPEGFTPPDISGDNTQTDAAAARPGRDKQVNARPDMGGGGGMGMGSEDVKLQYIDDDPASYSNIFGQAKTDISLGDQARLIQALKLLSEGETIEEAVDIDRVLRYFVVHNFLVNGDSYTGSMVHNYYLYEEDGRLSMIPWDYNLAFGTFQGGSADSAVNDPIDTPLSVTGSGDRPMADWIFGSEEYTQLYHQYFSDFLEAIDFSALIDETAALIAPYVEKDPSKFCTTEQFTAAAAAIREFCLLREQSILGQLEGTIPSTDSEQASADNLVDASHLTISDMGSMNMGGGKGGRGGMQQGRSDSNFGETTADAASQRTQPLGTQVPSNMREAFSPSGNEGLQTPSSQQEPALPLLAVSTAVLLAGLIIAKKYRH